jgi:RNA polymerase sigma-70 factor (ECF subfamily)
LSESNEFNDKTASIATVHPFEREIAPIWRLAQTGDEKAYEQALRLIAQRLRAFFRRRMNNTPEDAEDMVQETLMAIHTRRHTYDDAFPVSAWIMAIAKYKLIDFWRKHGTRDNLTDEFDETDMSQQSIMASDAATSNLADIQKLLNQLPDKQRQAIELIKLLGLSVSEAAQQTGLSESALKVQVHRGIKQLAALVAQKTS